VPTLIALVTRLDQAEEDAWLAALTTAMPNERLAPLLTLDPSQRRDVEIAIGAFVLAQLTAARERQPMPVADSHVMPEEQFAESR